MIDKQIVERTEGQTKFSSSSKNPAKIFKNKNIENDFVILKKITIEWVRRVIERKQGIKAWHTKF